MSTIDPKKFFDQVMSGWREIAGVDGAPPSSGAAGVPSPPSPPPRERFGRRHVISMTAPIPPGMSAAVTATLAKAFRPERLIISPGSFSLTRWHRLRTWPAVTVGRWIVRASRALGDLLRVDPDAARERREYVDAQEAIDSEEHLYVEYADGGDDEYEPPDLDEDGDVVERKPLAAGDRYFRYVAIPFNRRERIALSLGRLGVRLRDMRLRWQQHQVGHLFITNIRVGNASQLAYQGSLPGDLFASAAIDTFVGFDQVAAGGQLVVDITNTSAHDCRLAMAVIGIGGAS